VTDVSHPSRRRWWSVGYPLALLALVVGAVALVLVGRDAILANTEGALIRTVDNPADPGFELLVTPTPTFGVAMVDPAGQLSAVAVLSLASESRGAVLFLPPSLLVADEGAPPRSLGDVWADEGLEAMIDGVAFVLDASIPESRVIDAGQWAGLVEPVGNLVLANPDELVAPPFAEGAAGAVDPVPPQVFGAPEVDLAPGDIAAYLAAEITGESTFNRMLRVQRLWEAWITAVGERLEEPGVVPGEVATGLGRFVRALAASEVDYVTVPVDLVPLPGTDVVGVVPAAGDIGPFVARTIPFPIGPAPGERIRIRLLDGTGELTNGLPAVTSLVGNGAEVVSIGNAAEFGYARTQAIVSDSSQAAGARVLLGGIGGGEVVETAERADAVDITIILGANALDVLGVPGGG